jgi:hypothetical protein
MGSQVQCGNVSVFLFTVVASWIGRFGGQGEKEGEWEGEWARWRQAFILIID